MATKYRQARRSLAVVISTVVLMLAGCGLGEPTTPEGFTEVEVEGLHFAFPSDWYIDAPEDRPQHAAFSVVSDDTGAFTYSAGVEIGGEMTGTLRGLVDLSLRDARSSFHNVKVMSREPVQVQGAAEAEIVHVTYRTSDGLELVNCDLYVQRPSSEWLVFGVTGRQDSADLDLMRTIVDTAYID